jgi:hypothetical protein
MRNKLKAQGRLSLVSRFRFSPSTSPRWQAVTSVAMGPKDSRVVAAWSIGPNVVSVCSGLGTGGRLKSSSRRKCRAGVEQGSEKLHTNTFKFETYLSLQACQALLALASSQEGSNL